jgi:hypothetical protein
VAYYKNLQAAMPTTTASQTGNEQVKALALTALQELSEGTINNGWASCRDQLDILLDQEDGKIQGKGTWNSVSPTVAAQPATTSVGGSTTLQTTTT